MTVRNNTTDFAALFINDVPMMDVRAPIEFHQGAFPHSVNLPLMDDVERQKVGTCYKNEGQDAAIKLGHQLVSGEIKESRINAWSEFAKQHPNGYLYCFRGGLRSHVSQQWMKEAGAQYPLVEGGYKAMRRFLINTVDQQALSRSWVVLSGRTGTGKTKLIDATPSSFDLEGLANHRGSSFGRRATAQPTQINFENALAVEMLKKQSCQGVMMLEDESVAVGSIHIPKTLFSAMKQAPLVILEESLASRIDIVVQDYVVELLADHQRTHGEEQGWQSYGEYMKAAMDRIRKRLGNERHQTIKKMLEDALGIQQQTGDIAPHRAWISQLLSGYYDPMYDYQLNKKEPPVLFRGNRQEVSAWFEDNRLKAL